MRDVPCKFNLIPFNPFPSTEFRDESARSRIVAFQQILLDAGYVATIRKTRGDDIDAACGQLAGQRAGPDASVAPSNPARRRPLIMPMPHDVSPSCSLAAAVCSPRAAVAGCKLDAQQPEQRRRSRAAAGATAADVSPPSARKLHTELAAGYYERGQMDVALDELNEAVEARSRHAPTYNIYGLVYAVLRRDSKAEQNFQRALELAPNDSDIRHNWGWYLCTHEREREALAQFDIAMRNPLYKTPEIALVNAGRCSASIGDIAAGRGAISAGAGRRAGQRDWPRTASRSSPTRKARYDEARGWMQARDAAGQPAARSALPRACASSASSATARPNCRTSRNCATAIRTRRKPRRSPPEAASDRNGRTLPGDADAAAAPAPDGPGALLRAAREAAGLSLDAVAQQLKLAPRQVKALEDDDFGAPAGPARSCRGFVRNYARLLNLDAEDLLLALPDVAARAGARLARIALDGAMMAELPTPRRRSPNCRRAG